MNVCSSCLSSEKKAIGQDAPRHIAGTIISGQDAPRHIMGTIIISVKNPGFSCTETNDMDMEIHLLF